MSDIPYIPLLTFLSKSHHYHDRCRDPRCATESHLDSTGLQRASLSSERDQDTATAGDRVRIPSSGSGDETGGEGSRRGQGGEGHGGWVECMRRDWKVLSGDSRVVLLSLLITDLYTDSTNLYFSLSLLIYMPYGVTMIIGNINCTDAKTASTVCMFSESK